MAGLIWPAMLAKPALGLVYSVGIAVAQAPRTSGKPTKSVILDIRISESPFVLYLQFASRAGQKRFGLYSPRKDR